MAGTFFVQLKCIYTNAGNIGHKQKELEAIVQLENYDITITMKAWCNSSATMDSNKPFTRDKQGKRDSGVASMLLGTLLVVYSLKMVTIGLSVYGQ